MKTFSDLKIAMAAPIGTYICLCASKVTESAFSMPFNRYLYLSENKLGPPQAASTWKEYFLSLWQFQLSSSKGSIEPVSVVPAIPTMAAIAIFSLSSFIFFSKASTFILLSLPVSMASRFFLPKPKIFVDFCRE